MPTKTYLSLTVLLIFLTGIAFGFGMSDTFSPDRFRTTSERERILTQTLEQTRTNPNNPAENFLIQANGLGRNYTITLAAAGRETFRNQLPTTVNAVIDARSTALAAHFGRIIGRPAEETMSTALKQHTAAYLAYARAQGEGNQGRATQALTNMTASVSTLTALLNDLQLTTAVGQARLSLDQMNTALQRVVTETATGDLAASFTAEITASDQMATSTNAISTALIAKAPSRF